MLFLLEGKVEFNPKKGIVINKSIRRQVKLNYNNARLLEKILQNGERVTTRDEIFTEIFEATGASKTNGNLNQCVAIIRRTLQEVDISPEIIITVPKAGFCVSEGVKMMVLSESSLMEEDKSESQVSQPELLTEPPRQKTPQKATQKAPHKIRKKFVYGLFLVLAFYMLWLIIANCRNDTDLVAQENIIDQCTVNLFSHKTLSSGAASPSPEKISSLLKDKQIDCKHKPKTIYYYSHKLAGAMSWAFLGICEGAKGCSGYYLRGTL